jgi:hypothetical protein
MLSKHAVGAEIGKGCSASRSVAFGRLMVRATRKLLRVKQSFQLWTKDINETLWPSGWQVNAERIGWPRVSGSRISHLKSSVAS